MTRDNDTMNLNRELQHKPQDIFEKQNTDGRGKPQTLGNNSVERRELPSVDKSKKKPQHE